MKFLWILLIIICAIGIYFKSLVWRGGTPTTLGQLEGKLYPCGDKPNCQSSEIYPDKPQVPAYKSADNTRLWQSLQKAIVDAGGVIVTQEEQYLHATFTSKFFGFTDDFELRKNAEDNQVEVRSASRVGHSDMGANAKRIEQIRTLISG